MKNKDNKISPPKFTCWLYGKMFSDKGHYSTLGDLEQVYNEIANTNSEIRAKIWFFSPGCNCTSQFHEIFFRKEFNYVFKLS